MLFYTLLWCVGLTLVMGETTPMPLHGEGFPVPPQEYPVVLPAGPEDGIPQGQGETPQIGGPEGEIPEGETQAGEEPEGETPEGKEMEGETSEGEEPEGEEPEDEVPEGETQGGEEPEGKVPEGETQGGEEPEGEATQGGALPIESEGGESQDLTPLEKLLLAILLRFADQSERPAWDRRPFPCRFPNAPGCNSPGPGESQDGGPGQGQGHGRPTWLWRGGSGLQHGPEAEESA